MKINITYFGQLAELSGCKSEEIPIKNNTINGLLQELEIKLPDFKNKVFAVFVNNNKVDDTSHKLSEKDEVCLMPPFAGG